MDSTEIDPPPGWERIENRYNFQEATFQNGAGGDVIVIERTERINDKEWRVVLVGPDRHKNPVPNEEHKIDSLDGALKSAHAYMRANSDTDDDI